MVLNRRRLSFDVTGAYLQGEYSDDEVVYARPPRGYETFDDCGIMLVWWMPVDALPPCMARATRA